MRSFVIGKNDADQRLDRFLSKAIPSLSFPLVQKAIRTKQVKLDGRRASASDRVSEGQLVQVYIKEDVAPPTVAAWRPEPFDTLDIIFENEHVLLMHKPPGLLVHPDRHGSGRTLIGMAQSYLHAGGQWNPNDEHAFAPALAHRLDRNTGGLVLAAKSAEALRVLNEKFRDREIEKYYLCLVCGTPTPTQGLLRHHLERDRENCRVYVRAERSAETRTALTEYCVLETKSGLSLVECRLLTGRTHQIRAQWAAAGHPLWGDGKYGNNGDARDRGYAHQALYAHRLTLDFRTPAGCLEPLRGCTFAWTDIPFVALLHSEKRADTKNALATGRGARHEGPPSKR